jgi:hypothetical protein
MATAMIIPMISGLLRAIIRPSRKGILLIQVRLGLSLPTVMVSTTWPVTLGNGVGITPALILALGKPIHVAQPQIKVLDALVVEVIGIITPRIAAIPTATVMRRVIARVILAFDAPCRFLKFNYDKALGKSAHT